MNGFRLLVAAVCFVPLCAPGWAPTGSQASSATGSPVLVELFTSEGCSSCPPADRLLTRLADPSRPGSEVIALGFHVDYWNRLGWADRFSSPAYSQRQEDYARSFGNASVYTPQMVVDGTEEFVGGDRIRALAVLERAARSPKAVVGLKTGDVPDGRISVTVEITGIEATRPAHGSLVWLAVAENSLQNEVKRGENRGRTLRHTAVVRHLEQVGELKDRSAETFQGVAQIPLDGDWKRPDLRLVAFVQEAETLRILGVGSAAISPR